MTENETREFEAWPVELSKSEQESKYCLKKISAARTKLTFVSSESQRGSGIEK